MADMLQGISEKMIRASAPSQSALIKAHQAGAGWVEAGKGLSEGVTKAIEPFRQKYVGEAVKDEFANTAHRRWLIGKVDPLGHTKYGRNLKKWKINQVKLKILEKISPEKVSPDIVVKQKEFRAQQERLTKTIKDLKSQNQKIPHDIKVWVRKRSGILPGSPQEEMQKRYASTEEYRNRQREIVRMETEKSQLPPPPVTPTPAKTGKDYGIKENREELLTRQKQLVKEIRDRRITPSKTDLEKQWAMMQREKRLMIARAGARGRAKPPKYDRKFNEGEIHKMGKDFETFMMSPKYKKFGGTAVGIVKTLIGTPTGAFTDKAVDAGNSVRAATHVQDRAKSDFDDNYMMKVTKQFSRNFDNLLRKINTGKKLSPMEKQSQLLLALRAFEKAKGGFKNHVNRQAQELAIGALWKGNALVDIKTLRQKPKKKGIPYIHPDTKRRLTLYWNPAVIKKGVRPDKLYLSMYNNGQRLVKALYAAKMEGSDPEQSWKNAVGIQYNTMANAYFARPWFGARKIRAIGRGIKNLFVKARLVENFTGGKIPRNAVVKYVDSERKTREFLKKNESHFAWTLGRILNPAKRTRAIKNWRRLQKTIPGLKLFNTKKWRKTIMQSRRDLRKEKRTQLGVIEEY